MTSTLPGADIRGYYRALAGGENWWAQRLSVVRCFATYLHALDPAHEIPPADVLTRRARRGVPYLYTEQEIWALMAATERLRGRLRQMTYRTLIGLLAVTGMRVGEAIRLDRTDLELAAGLVMVRTASSGSHASCRCTRRPSLRCASTCGSAPLTSTPR